METLKKGLRLSVVILLMILAAFGIGFGGNFLNNRERYMDKEVRIENVEKREDEEKEDQTKI